MESVLDVRELTAGYFTQNGLVVAVTNVNFNVKPNEIVAIAGESGCGKSTLAMAIYGLLKYPAVILKGHVYLNGKDILSMDKDKLRELRMKEFAYIPQFAMDALDPVTKIGDQMIRAALSHGVSESEAHKLVKEKLEIVDLPPNVLNMYPMELSGGMRQRVVIATSILLNPSLIILDEPTTGLDVLVQYEILKDLKKIQRKLGISLLLISHDLSMLMMIADRVAIMYAGEIVEISQREELLKRPSHPYTMLLLNSLPSLIQRRKRLLSIPGNPPLMLSKVPISCRFSDRCPFVMERCKDSHPALVSIGEGHNVRCLLHQERYTDLSNLSLPPDYYVEEEYIADDHEQGNIVMKIENLSKTYFVRKKFVFTEAIDAVNNVSFDLKKYTITALIGGSGHGKSTIARILAGLVQQTSGKIYLLGEDVSEYRLRNSMWYKENVQMIFQDPYSSLDPRHNVMWHIERPLLIHKKVSDEKHLQTKISEILKSVGLKPPEKYLYKYPHELSGGERQRVAIARAIAVEPKVLIADEPVSMLDASLRAGILNLLKRFKSSGMSILYITHDIATVSYIADEIMVIYRGKIVEKGKTDEVISNPSHEYTKRLIEAIPDPYKTI
ncbi:ABC transporter ATP-binding protein [Sulfolobus tengchongensis]|uniref:ABC transporter ATP-binding protein n=1 Tax=Sulfolobus tengchongensis TaxID=207809 RepID=A0AAX4KXX4_9CREN